MHAAVAARRRRVALCHLESLVCVPAINELFKAIGEDIGLIFLSNRFGGKYGGPVRQLAKGIRRSGWRLTLWLGFDIMAAQAVSKIAGLLGIRRTPCKSVRALAQMYKTRVIETADINGAACLDALRGYAPDVVLVINFDQILRQAFIDAAGCPVVNIHPSLLPLFRGPCPVLWAMMEGRTEVGVTLHLIDGPEIDAGPIISQTKAHFNRSTSVAEATTQLFTQGVRLLISYLGTRQKDLLPQDASAATYRTFPNRAEMVHARSVGARLVGLRHLARLILTSFGSPWAHLK